MTTGPALKVTIYLNDDTGSENAFLHEELLSFLQARGIAGASAWRPYAGFGSHRALHVEGGGSVRGEHLPFILSFVDTPEKVNGILQDLLALVSDGLVEVHPTQILKSIAASTRVIT